MTLREHLEKCDAARITLTGMHNELLLGNGSQFVHKHVPAGDGTAFMVRHEREGCRLCDEVDEVWKALTFYRRLVLGFLTASEEEGQERARERAAVEYTERIERETRAYLLSRPEFVEDEGVTPIETEMTR